VSDCRSTESDPPSLALRVGKKASTEMQDATAAEIVTASHSPPVAPGSKLLTGEKLPLRLASLSALRYPGSKRRMIPAIRQLINANTPEPELFVEPFCGGASAALGLLELGAVQRVMLADIDPLVVAFWRAATRDAEGLIKEFRRLDVTVEQWDYWRQARPRSVRQRALKCLFLNRTSFSDLRGGTAC
jgi:DNA adenine methylase